MNFSLSPRIGKALVASGILMATLTAAAPAAAGYAYGPVRPGAQNSNWGGYVAQGEFTSITGSWVEPKVTCTSSNNLFAPWVGIDGYGSQTVEQTGVQTDCSTGHPVISPWYEMYPANPVYWNEPVSVGDKITGMVVANGGGSYTLTLTDNTKGWTKTVQKSLQAQDISAEAVIESPTSSYPSFSKLSFSGVKVDGQPFDTFGPTPLDSGGYGPGTLHGGSFTMKPGAARTRTHSRRPSIIRY